MIPIDTSDQVPPPEPNARVRHGTFGEGTVTKVDTGRIGTEVTVRFDKHGEKVLQWCFAAPKVTVLGAKL